MDLVTQSGGYLTLLKKRNFLLLWLAQLISQIIFNASNYALLIVISGRSTEKASATAIGIAIICFTIPAIIFGAPAGVVVDHMDKRLVLWGTNCLRALATFAFVVTLLFARSALLPIYLLTILISTITQFFAPAEGAAIPLLVDEKELTPALSLFNITLTLSQALGYVLLAPLALLLLPQFTLLHFTLDSIIELYMIIGLLYLVCSGLILMIPRANFAQKRRYKSATGPVTAETLGVMSNVWHEMYQGWSFVRAKKPLFLAVVQLSFAGILILVIGQIALPIVTNLLSLPRNAMAFVFAPAGIGLVGGSAIIPRIIQRLGRSRTVLCGTIGLALAMLLLPLSTLLAHTLDPQSWNTNPLLLFTIALLMLAAGLALAFVNVSALSGMQELTPDWIKGRVLALQLVLYSIFSIPVILFLGVASDALGIDRVLYIMSFCSLAFGAWGIYYERKHPPSLPASEAGHRQAQTEPDTIEPGPLTIH
ncbi:MAG TPA: MFS transporter [Ktedonosporobacter sp.]|nr:MFS transporter [Ktedonosporobacter sp.]